MKLQEIGQRFAKTKSEKDFSIIYHLLKPSLHNYLRILVPDSDNRKEVIDITFSNVWSKIDQYDSYWNFSTWVYRIARNESLLFYRKRKKMHSYDAMYEMGIVIEPAYIDIDDTLEKHEDHCIDVLHDCVIDEIYNLPEIYKTVLHMYHVNRQKYEDIAKELNWNHNTVRTRIKKGRQLIKAEIEKNKNVLLTQYKEKI